MNWKFWEKDDDPLADLSKEFESPASDSPGGQDDLGLPDTPGTPQPSQQGGQSSFGQQQNPAQNPAFNQPQQRPQQQQQYTPDNHPSNVAFTPTDQQASGGDKDARMDLVLARLDSIRTQLDVINQRLENLEAKEKQGGRGPWYANQ